MVDRRRTSRPRTRPARAASNDRWQDHQSTRDLIAQWLPLLVRPDDVFEVRGLDVGEPGRKVTGFVRGDRIEATAGKIAALAAEAGGVYFTPQGLNPAVLARSDHRLVECRRKGDQVTPQPTRDEDVTARRYLLIDVDPIKACGFEKCSATDEEKAAAWGVADRVRTYFRGVEWAGPLIVDSGNGGHLYYPLPALLPGGPVADPTKDDLAVLLKILKAKFDTPGARIDGSVYNASRIMKVPGTWARKGPDTEERPHRQCRVVGEPDGWNPGTPAAAGKSVREVIQDLDPDGSIRARRASKAEQPGAAVAASPDRPRTAELSNRVRAYIKAHPGAVSGQRGHDRCFEVAQALLNGFCLSRDEAIGYLLSEFNARCPADDQWTPREIEHKVDEAARKPCGKPRGWLLNAELPGRSRPAAVHPGDPPPAPTPTVGHPATAPDAPRPARGRPTIIQYPRQLCDVVKEAVEALASANDPPALFVYGDSLAQVDANAEGKHVRTLSKAQLRHTVSKSARWVNQSTSREGGEINKEAYPRQEVVETIQDHMEWPGLPRLRAVVDVPVITRESGLLTRPGFDAASGYYLLPGGYSSAEPVSEAPDADCIETARELLLTELLGDFPFADDASRANALALFILPFVRDLVDGSTPLHHIDAPQEGTGKGLLAKTWGAVALGAEPKALAEVTRPDDWQKLVLAALIEAPRVIFLDNINHSLDSGALASSLTASDVSGRLLGFSRMVSAPVRCVWLSTANNIRMSRELVRRTVYIRLDASQDVAWVNREFRHELPRWAFLNRGRLVWACLTLCQAWVSAGMPRGRSLLGGFEQWSAVIDGVLSNAGVTGLLGNAGAFRAATVDSQDEWRTFVSAWWDRYRTVRVGVNDLFRLASGEELLDEVLGDGKEHSQRSRLGHALRKLRDRVFDGIKVEQGTKDKSGRASYRLSKEGEDVEDADATTGVIPQ